MITRDEEFKEKSEGFILADIEVCNNFCTVIIFLNNK